MNQNIKIINPKLWIVNFNYVTMGYIQELGFTVTNANDAMCLMDDGRLILNSALPKCDQCIPYIQAVMKISTPKLYTQDGFLRVLKNISPSLKSCNDKQIEQFIQQNNLGALKSIYLDVCNWETQRRKLQKTFIQENRKPIDVRLSFENFLWKGR